MSIKTIVPDVRIHHDSERVSVLPADLGIEKGTRIPPPDGWEDGGLYVVEVSYAPNNPIHTSILWVGFISSGEPAGYSYVYDNASGTSKYSEPYYLKVISKIAQVS